MRFFQLQNEDSADRHNPDQSTVKYTVTAPGNRCDGIQQQDIRSIVALTACSLQGLRGTDTLIQNVAAMHLVWDVSGRTFV
jgi:hypothetical protein